MNLSLFKILPVCLILMMILGGCSGNSLDYREIKRIDERITNREYRTFLKIISRLPEKNLSDFPTVYIPAPEWRSDRALPVEGLVQEEMEKNSQRWDEAWMARLLKDNRHLNKALKYQGMTREQFVGLTLTIGMAMSKKTLREDQDLETIISRGNQKIKKLSEYKETFSSIKDKELQFSILNNAVWISRVSRAKKLIDVPDENVAFVQKNWDQLVKIFPEEFSTNPLDSIADLLEEMGMPFEEPESRKRSSNVGVYRIDPDNLVRGSDPILN